MDAEPVKLSFAARLAAMKELGERRRAQILEFIADYWTVHGYAPSVREVGRGVGLSSPSSVYSQLVQLERAGLLLWEPTIARSLRVVQQP